MLLAVSDYFAFCKYGRLSPIPQSIFGGGEKGRNKSKEEKVKTAIKNVDKKKKASVWHEIKSRSEKEKDYRVGEIKKDKGRKKRTEEGVRNGGGGGNGKKKTVRRKAFVIYSTFGSFLTNYTQASKQGCKYS